MIQPISIRLKGGSIEIASGDFLGHSAGTFETLYDDRGIRWLVAGGAFTNFDAALNACLSAAYAYVAQELEGAAA